MTKNKYPEADPKEDRPEGVEVEQLTLFRAEIIRKEGDHPEITYTNPDTTRILSMSESQCIEKFRQIIDETWSYPPCCFPRNQIPNVDREQPDFRCKFSMGSIHYHCQKEGIIRCTGLEADRKRCPYWNK